MHSRLAAVTGNRACPLEVIGFLIYKSVKIMIMLGYFFSNFSNTTFLNWMKSTADEAVKHDEIKQNNYYKQSFHHDETPLYNPSIR